MTEADYTYHFDITSIDKSERTIAGEASAPVLDKEQEVILSKAIADALPNYMALPIITYQHTERPVGMCMEARVQENGKLFVKCKIKDTPDADDVWGKIEKGEINAFSIYGRRKNGTESCKLPPYARTVPCITKAIDLYTITLCGDGKVNPEAWFNVVKAVAMTSNDENVLKSEDTTSSLMHTAVDGTPGISAQREKKSVSMPTQESTEPHTNDAREPAPAEVDKADSSTEINRKLDKLLELLGGRVMKCSEDRTMTEDTKEKEQVTKADEVSDVEPSKEPEVKKTEDEKDKTEEPVKKAEPVATPDPNEIVKSLEGKFDDIVKAHMTDFISKAEEIQKAVADLRADVEKMKTETIQKGGNVVVIPDEGKGYDNASAVSKFLRRK